MWSVTRYWADGTTSARNGTDSSSTADWATALRWYLDHKIAGFGVTMRWVRA